MKSEYNRLQDWPPQDSLHGFTSGQRERGGWLTQGLPTQTHRGPRRHEEDLSRHFRGERVADPTFTSHSCLIHLPRLSPASLMPYLLLTFYFGRLLPLMPTFLLSLASFTGYITPSTSNVHIPRLNLYYYLFPSSLLTPNTISLFTSIHFHFVLCFYFSPLPNSLSSALSLHSYLPSSPLPVRLHIFLL